MTCKDLMTHDPAFCVPEDNAVRVAMLMKHHNIGSIPVVKDRATMKLDGIVTDRDLTVRVVAEQRDYYNTHISDVMSTDLVTCKPTDDYEDVVKAMTRKQIRRVPVVDSDNRLLGIISQADVARKADAEETGRAVEAISEPSSRDSEDDGGAFAKTTLLLAGGLGLGAALFYLIDPERARQAGQQLSDRVRNLIDDKLAAE